jgi:AICAR transformylase/IMP cyclohydrolase PurH
VKIRRALLSVSDKTGLVELARGLAAHGVELLSTGGTASALRAAGLTVKDVSEHTGFPEMLDGRVKTLHPFVHGGLLFRRDLPEHVRQAESHGIAPIDLVVVNLYPFEQTVARPGVTREEAIENIDIGGPSMLRSAAKNHAAVTVVCDPDDYATVLEEMKANDGASTLPTRERLARKVFALTSRYDGAIAAYLGGAKGGSFECAGPLAMNLRYGENPHQSAELYGNLSSHLEQLHGKELSYNNLLDITAAVDLIGEFEEPTVAILKHTNPCGVGSDASLLGAWDKAFATDRQAPFGGIIICNRPLDEPLAAAIAEIFSEVIIAPDFSAASLEILRKKKNLRLMRLKESARSSVASSCRITTQPPKKSPTAKSRPSARPRRRKSARLNSVGRWSNTSNPTPWSSPDPTAPSASEPARCRVSIRSASPCGKRARPGSRWPAARWPAMPFSLSRTVSSPRPRPGRPPPSNPAARCATRTLLRRPTSAAWPWSSPENVTSGIKLLRIPHADALACPP